MKFLISIEGDAANENDRRMLREFSALLNSTPTALSAPPSDDDESAGVVMSQPGALDKDGLPWDVRIHSDAKTQTDKGFWRKRRGVSDVTIAVVSAELKARSSSTVPVGNPPPPPSAAPPPAPPAASVSVAPPPSPAPAAPTIPPPPPATSGITFPALMAEISASTAAGKINPEFTQWMFSQIPGVTGFNDFASDPALCQRAHDLLVQENRLA